MDLENVKHFVPAATGCRVWNEPQTDRIRVSYRSDDSTTSTSWSLKRWTVQQAIIRCLRWAWGQHGKCSGELCPFADELSGAE